MNNIGNIQAKVHRWQDLTARKKNLLYAVGMPQEVSFNRAAITLTPDQVRPLLDAELEIVASELVPLEAALNRCCELLGIGAEPDIMSEF